MTQAEQPSLSSNLEDYLEAIYHLQAGKKVARAKDIAERMGVSRASVTGALKTLAEKGLVNYEPYSYTTLTRAGEAVAGKIVGRHAVLKDFFQHILMLGAEAAEENACRVEHSMDDEAMDRLVQFLDFLRVCPRSGEDWLKNFRRFCRQPQEGSLPLAQDDCRACLEKCTGELTPDGGCS